MKKILSLVVIFALVLSVLAACTGNSGSAPAKGDNTNVKNDEKNAGKDDGLVELDLFINHSWYPVSSWKGAIAEAITEKTGVKLNVTVASDPQQLQLMLASGDLPDLIFTTRETRLETEELVYPWNELIEQYAPDFEIDPIRLGVNTAPDGNVYTVLNAYGTPEEWANNPYALGHDGNPGIAVREDILEELGNPSIDTLEDFVNVLDQVKNKYPDMTPLVMDIEWIKQYFQMQHGVPPHGTWYEENGQAYHKVMHPNMLDYYKFMNNLYRNGYVLAENFTFSNDQIDDEYAVSGRAFAHMHTVSRADANNAAAKKQGADYKFKMLSSVLTDKAVNIDSATGFSGVYITKNNSNPEKSIQFLKYLASDEGRELVMFGIEGEQWEWHEDGYPSFHYDVTDEEYINEQGLKWWYLYSDAIVEGLRGYVPGTMQTEALTEIKGITKYEPGLGLIRIPSDSDERVILDRLNEMIKNEEIKIYLAESEEAAEQAYANMLKLADDIGLNKLTDFADNMYQEKKQLFE